MDGKNKNDDLLKSKKNEQVDIEEHIEKQSQISKILKNKKIMITLFVALIILGIFFLMSPKKEKEANIKENVQTAGNIDVDQLKDDGKEEEKPENTESSNNNQQELFSFQNDNLNADDSPNIEARTGTDQNYGNYPSYYDLDTLSDDNTGNSGKKSKESKKISSISFERGNKQANSEAKGEEQEQTKTQTQGQIQNVPKNTFRLNSGLTAPNSPFEIKTGELIPAVLMTGIDSDLTGNITAVVREDVYDSIRGRYLLIPKGSKLYGTYDSNIIYGQNRLILIWQRIILPNGYTINLEAMQGIDMTGQAGVRGKVNNHTLKLLRSVVLSALFNFVSSGVGVSYNKSLDNDGKVSVGATIGSDVADDTAGKLQSAGDMIVARDLQQQPTIKIKAGTKFSIMVNNDMVLYPYNKLKGVN